jgi:MEMO1 family protein
MDRKNLVRHPAVAGAFYPGEENELKNTVLGMLAYSGSEQLNGRIIGIISPHAGYIYSGRIAAKAYKQIQSKQYDNVIVIAPSHFEYFDGCSIYFGNYQTPLGIVSTNIEIADSIVSQSPAIMNSSKGHFREHSLEVQIPFLQICLPDFKLIPVVMGKQDYLTAEKLSNAVYTVLSDPGFENQSTLIVGSSDLSHYYPAKIAKEMDGIVINDIDGFDEKRLFDDIQSNICEACGYGAMISTMMIAKALGATKSKVLAYGTSGETSQDYNNVVGYVSGIFYN